MNALSLPEIWDDYVNNPRHVQDIQASLMKKFKKAKGFVVLLLVFASELNALCICEPVTDRLVPSWVGRNVRFNGFFFAVNVERIAPLAAAFPHALFDPHMKMVGQEDWLAKRLREVHIVPKMSKSVFIYHFKSVTVRAANYVWKPKQADVRENLK